MKGGGGVKKNIMEGGPSQKNVRGGVSIFKHYPKYEPERVIKDTSRNFIRHFGTFVT